MNSTIARHKEWTCFSLVCSALKLSHAFGNFTQPLVTFPHTTYSQDFALPVNFIISLI